MFKVKFPQKKYLITHILILIALWFGACKGGALPEKDSQDFRFVFATDVHLMPHKRAVEGFNQAITAIISIFFLHSTSSLFKMFHIEP
jgi:hypothetical protein